MVQLFGHTGHRGDGGLPQSAQGEAVLLGDAGGGNAREHRRQRTARDPACFGATAYVARLQCGLRAAGGDSRLDPCRPNPEAFQPISRSHLCWRRTPPAERNPGTASPTRRALAADGPRDSQQGPTEQPLRGHAGSGSMAIVSRCVRRCHCGPLAKRSAWGITTSLHGFAAPPWRLSVNGPNWLLCP
jgi:hypothetical protein